MRHRLTKRERLLGSHLGGKATAQIPGALSSAGRLGALQQMRQGIGMFAPGYLQRGIGGRLSGHLAAEKEIGICNPAWAGYGLHIRWHINEGLVSKKPCRWCRRKKGG